MSILVMISLATVVSPIHASVKENKKVSEVVHTSSEESITQISSDIIDIANQYVKFNGSNFVITNESALNAELSDNQYKELKSQLASMNSSLNSATHDELNQGKVVGDSIIFSKDPKTKGLEMIANTGRNAFEIHWWGYKIYLNDHYTRTVYQMLYSGAGGAALYAKLAPLWSAPTAIVKGVLWVAAAAGGGLARLMQTENNGKGVYVRFTGILPSAVIFTGVHPQ